MITAANRDTKQIQEVLAVESGAVMMTPEDCLASHLSESATLATGPCRLVGPVLNTGTEAATVVVESNSEIKMKAKITNGCRPVLPALPVTCPGDLVVTLTGAGADVIVYYVPR